MNKLETIYENEINFPTFLERKIKIENNFTILYGAKATGKTFLIYDYLASSNKNYLYIDLNNFKINLTIFNHIQQFIDDNDIEILIIENYIYSIKLPKIDSIILSTNEYQPLNSFIPLEVMPLDFEEYLLFDTKHQNTTNSFNSFLKYGNLPDIIEYKDFKKPYKNQETLELYEKNPTSLEILKLLIKSSGETKSPFWLYSILKKDIKISKDLFYKKIKEYENNSVIFFCEKYLHPKAVKRIFTFNHALIDTVSSEKKFINVFSNMIFLELYSKFNKVYYMDAIDFYIEEISSIILCMPFFNKILFSNLTNKILKSLSTIKVKNITIVTISNYDTIYLNNTQCDVIPFYEWSLTN